MASVDRLKAKAKQAEAKQNWKVAIGIWNQVLELQRSGKAPNALDLAQYNRLGDLHLKVGEPAKASNFFESAADRYIESGFLNNAIALCNKVLRYAPTRDHIYLKLAKLLTQKGFVGEGKQHFLTYADRMQKAGREAEAVAALRELSTLAPNSGELQALLDQYGVGTTTSTDDIDPEYQLDEAAEGTAEESPVKTGSRKTRSLVFLSLDEEKATPVARPTSRTSTLPDDLPLLDPETIEAEAEERERVFRESQSVEPVPDEEQASLIIDEAIPADVDGARIGVTPTEMEGATLDEGPSTDTLDGLEVTSVEEEPELDDEDVEELDIQRPTDPELAARSVAVDGFEATEATTGLEDVDIAEEPGLDIESVDVAESVDDTAVAADAPTEEDLVAVPDIERDDAVDATIPLSPVELEEVQPPLGVAELEAAVADDPDDARAHRMLGEALVEEGDRERGLAELDIAATQHTGAARFDDARAVLEEITRIEPNSIDHLQRLVELAFRAQDRSRLISSYLALADALVRLGAVQKAMAVYDRVIEHDADNAAARSAMDMLRPSKLDTAIPVPDIQHDIDSAKMRVLEEAPEGTDFVDFRDMVIEETPTDSRLRVEEGEPTGDEERDFVEILDQFRKGIDETIEEEDYQAHYDLGIAFKEMGLLDDAISEFQKALRSSSGQLMTTEALGTCFFEKDQFAVAESILRRGLEFPATDDQERIGVLYWLARSLEAQQKVPDALQQYQRIVAVDIRFADVETRVKDLAGAQL